jgi:chromosome segregation ATPase
MHIEVRPNELVFEHVQLHQSYTARVELFNPHEADIDLTIKPSAAQRYQIRPEQVHIPAGKSSSVMVRLKIMHFPNKKKGKTGQRDYFHMKARYFEQKFFTTFTLEGTPLKHAAKGRKVPERQRKASNIPAGRYLPQTNRVSFNAPGGRAKEIQTLYGERPGIANPLPKELPRAPLEKPGGGSHPSRKREGRGAPEYKHRTGETKVEYLEGENNRLAEELEMKERELKLEKEREEDRSQRVLEILREKDLEVQRLKGEHVNLVQQLETVKRKENISTSRHNVQNDDSKEWKLQLEACKQEKAAFEEEVDALRSTVMQLNQTSCGERSSAGIESISKIRDQEEQIEVLISEVAKLREEKENGSWSSAVAHNQNELKSLKYALEEEVKKSGVLMRENASLKNQRVQIDKSAEQLDLANKTIQRLKQDIEVQNRKLDEKDEKIAEVSSWRDDLQKQLESKQQSNKAVANLRQKVTELEHLQQTASQTVIDSEHRLSMAVDQIEALQRDARENNEKQSTGEDPLAIIALKTAKATVDDLQARLNLSLGNERMLKSKISEIMEEEIKMARLEQKRHSGKNPIQFRHTVRSLVMRLDKFRNPDEENKKNDLQAIDYLQKELEAKIVEIVDIRQEMVRQGVEARRRLREAEESLIERNLKIIEYENKLRMHKQGRETEVRELVRSIRILKGNSKLHHQIAGLTAEIASLKKVNLRQSSQSRTYSEQMKVANERSRLSRMEVDGVRKELSRLKIGVAGTNITNVSAEQIIISLCIKRGEDREEIKRLNSTLDGLDSYKRVLPTTQGAQSAKVLKRSLDKHREDLNLLTDSAVSPENCLSILQLQSQRLQCELTTLNNELTERENSYHALQCELIDVKEKHVQEITKRDEAHAKQAASQNRRLASYNTENGILRLDLRKCERELREARARLLNVRTPNTESIRENPVISNKKTQLKHSADKLLASRSEVQKLKSLLKDRATQLSVLMETIEVLQSDTEIPNRESGALGIRRVQDHVVQLTAHVTESSASLSKCEQRLEDCRSHLRNANAELRETRDNQNGLLSTISILETTVARERSETDKMRKALDESNRRNQMFQLDVEGLKLQNEDIRRECESWETQLRRARERYLKQLRDHMNASKIKSEAGNEAADLGEFGTVVEHWRKLTTCLQDLTNRIGVEMSQNGGLAWVVEKLKQMILDNDVTVADALKMAKASSWEAESYRRKIIMLENCLERFISKADSSPYSEMQLMRRRHMAREAMLRGNIEFMKNAHSRKDEEMRLHLQEANMRVMELEVLSRHSQLDCQLAQARLHEVRADRELTEISPSETELAHLLQSIKNASRVVENLVTDSRADHNSILIRMSEGLVSDARMDEGHAQEAQLERLNRALEEAKLEIDLLTEWKTEAMAREERLRLDFQEGAENNGLKAQERAKRIKSKFSKQLVEEAASANNTLIASKMKYENIIEGLKGQLRNGAQTNADMPRLQNARKEREVVDNENLKLLTKVKVLSSELKTLESQQIAKEGAIKDLHEYVAKIAEGVGMAGASTKDGLVVDTADAFATELVNSKIKISELQRKLRVANRVESELRRTIATRENRIADLKAGTSKTESREKITHELTTALADERARVNILQKQLLAANEIEAGDTDIKGMYAKIERMSAREEKMRKEIMRLTLGSKMRDGAKGDSSVAFAVGNELHEEEVHGLKIRIKELENNNAFAEDGLMGKRLAYLENALETSEKQRQKLTSKLSKLNDLNGDHQQVSKKRNAQIGSGPSENSDLGDNAIGRDTPLPADYSTELRVLRRKYDNALAEIETLRAAFSKKDQKITALRNNNKSLKECEHDLRCALDESNQMLLNNESKLKDETKQIESVRSSLEKRQVQFESQISKERAALTQSAVKIEGDLRSELSKANAHIQHLEASAIELKAQLTTMTRTNDELLARIKDRDAQYSKEVTRLRLEHSELQARSIAAETSYSEDMSATSAHAQEVEESNALMKQHLSEMASTNAELINRLRDFAFSTVKNEGCDVEELRSKFSDMQSRLVNATEKVKMAEKKAYQAKITAAEKTKSSLEHITEKAKKMHLMMEKIEEERNYFTSRISKLESERKKLKEKVDQLNAQKSDAESKIAELLHEKETRNDIIAKKIADSLGNEERSRLHELDVLRKEEVKAKQSEIDDLTDKVRSYEADIKRIVKNATFDKTSLEQTTADLKLRLDRTQRELETAREAKDNAVYQGNRKLRETEAKSFEQLDELRKELVEIKSHASTAEISLEKARNSEERLEKRVNSLQKQEKEFLKRNEKELAKLREVNDKALEGAMAELTEAQEKLKKNENEVQKYKDKLESERIDITEKLGIIYEEGTRRQEANDNLVAMFESQVLSLKGMFNDAGKDGDLIAKLAERTAAVENLRIQLHNAKDSKEKVVETNKTSNSRFHKTNAKQIVDVTDLSVLELRCSRLGVEKLNAVTEIRLLREKIDDAERATAALQKRFTQVKKSEEKAKNRIKSVAKIANGKTRALKAEAARLRDQIDVMRKNWKPPGEWTEQEKIIKALRDAARSLKKDLQKKIDASQKFDQEKKDETNKWKDMENSLKNSEAKMKRAISEASRKASVEQHLRKKLDADKTELLELKKKVERYETQIKGLKRALEQRRIAMESMRHGIDDQKGRLAAIQDTIRNQEILDQSNKETKVLAERKSREAKRATQRATEAETTCREALDKISDLKSTVEKMEKTNKKLKDSTIRKTLILEAKLSAVKESASIGVLNVARKLVDNNQRLRSRVGALKGALISPSKSESVHSTEQLTSVATMLDMSMQEVKSLLGSAKKQKTPAQSHVHGESVGTPVRAMHDQALARLESAFTQDQVDGTLIQNVLMQLINEKLALEKNLVEVQQGLKNKQDRAEDAPVPAPRTAYGTRHVGTLDSNETEARKSGSRVSNSVVRALHINRKGSVDIILRPKQNVESFGNSLNHAETTFIPTAAHRAPPEYSSVAPLRPQKRAALERRLEELQSETVIATPVPRRHGMRAIGTSDSDQSIDMSMMSPSPFKK